ncbi:FAD-dependent oxidoreductase [Pseudonocardia adelaidensis]|uniref:FAD-dependent oxidoreductase n=1 Tax=Pseudonocardia adelaidensis TaxID=648754 RepID=UPI003CD098CF
MEREVAGFGASGRNGGWCSALFPAGRAALARRHGAVAADAMRAAMRAAVDEVGTAVADEGIDCGWVKGGTLVLARTRAQLTRARTEASGGPDRVELLGPDEASVLVGAAGVLGATYTPDWGGPLGIPRDWHAGVGLGPDGLGWAGGYVGDGVATSNLAGRTLAALVLGRDDPLVGLPWVGHRSRRWEPEPLRWLLVNAGLRPMTVADEEERLTGRPSVLATSLARALGG